VTDVFLEAGDKWVFASAAEWPGWSRRGKTDDRALAAMVAYAPRYWAALGPDSGFVPPEAVAELEVVERLRGGATTDFGAPGAEASSEGRPIEDAELGRLTELLGRCWFAFDRVADAAAGRELTKGPRGGGRERDGIIDHVRDAEEAYLRGIGGSVRDLPGHELGTAVRMAALRARVLETLAERAAGVPPPPSPRRTRAIWSVRYLIRRSAWHALDHAWEIEDRLD
jgi:hypothetical protein